MKMETLNISIHKKEQVICIHICPNDNHHESLNKQKQIKRYQRSESYELCG